MGEYIGKKARIMIVDDVPQNLQLLEGMLLEQGYQVYLLPSGEMALKAAARTFPDLILLDILMPEMDGYEVCARLKKDAALRDVPVIFLSALNEPLDKVKAFELGAVDYVTKPFQVAEVEARVRTHLQLRHLQRELASHNARLETTVQERTQQLSDAHARLEVLDKAKSDFLTIISHELRTPLNGLFGIAELLFMNVADANEADVYRQPYVEARDRILTLVEDALLLTQINVAGEDRALKTCRLESVLARAAELANTFAASAGVSLGVDSSVSCEVFGDSDLLERALHSLLVTAVRFCKKGGVVSLTLDRASTLLKIETSGRSIPGDELPRFFEVLAIGKTITAGGDLGLAPAVADCLIRAFGGKISVENLLPSGIRLSVHLRRVG
jgi:two-component system, sensor histidine kinase and response regulator